MKSYHKMAIIVVKVDCPYKKGEEGFLSTLSRNISLFVIELLLGIN